MRSFTEMLQLTDHLSDERMHQLISKIKKRDVKKGEVLQSKGDIKPKGFYVKKGILRSYTIDVKGKEHIYMFGSEGWVIADLEMHVNGTAATLFIDVVEDAEIEEVDISDLSEFQEVLVGNRVDEEMDRLLKRITVLQRRVIMLMSATVAERYQDFIDTYPDIVQRVPQRMIASYLGVTPEALSKVKSTILRS